ncbi:MAG: hypothetical protein ACYC54_00240 [Sedimentisphaerales bacterium]
MAKKRYTINPPPKEKGLFRVVYSIDVSASDVKQAAENAFQVMQSKDSFAPVLVVMDSKGKQTTIDLADTMEFNKITTGFVCQKFRKNESGKFICIHHEFVAGDDVQFETLKGDSIEIPEHDYQPFNMTLISRDEIADRLNELLTSIDVGGEQSRQFAHEIGILNKLLTSI